MLNFTNQVKYALLVSFNLKFTYFYSDNIRKKLFFISLIVVTYVIGCVTNLFQDLSIENHIAR